MSRPLPRSSPAAASASKGPNRIRLAPAPLIAPAIRRLYTASFLYGSPERLNCASTSEVCD
jgi:hypothetical protein